MYHWYTKAKPRKHILHLSYTSVEGKKNKTTYYHAVWHKFHTSYHTPVQERDKTSHSQPHLELLQRLLKLSPRWRHAAQTMGSVTRICLWVALFWGSKIWSIMTGRWYTWKNKSHFDDYSQYTEEQNMLQATNQNKHGWILGDIMCS